MPSSISIEEQDEDYVSIPHGGPIYMCDMVGPLTSVSEFESSVLQELQDLEEEICWDSREMHQYDISVEELKILTEEELVDKAFEVAFKDDAVSGNSSQLSEGQSNTGRSSTKLASRESSGRGSDAVIAADNGEMSEEISKKRKRMTRKCRKINTLEGSYVAEVEKLARIKQKQDEDKASVRLHSFSGASGFVACAPVCSDKMEKMSSFKSLSSSVKVRSSRTREHVLLNYPEILLCIEVFHSQRSWVKTRELLVLGCEPLCEMKDKIQCMSDEIMERTGHHDPSGYFLIEDVFCNDLREPSATDYSKPIFDWLRDHKKIALEKWECIISGELQQKQKELLGSGNGPILPQFKSVQMHKTRFCDLRFRLGAGYLYCHQGDCKHSIVIRDMRLIHPEDVKNRAAYPLVIYQPKLRFRKCSACKIYRAEKVTVDDKWAPENPCYFCSLCYYMLHYVDGSLLYNDFSVYDYLHELQNTNFTSIFVPAGVWVP